ncbi:MAG: triose-phosphate isomerase [Bacteroidota bacterium]
MNRRKIVAGNWKMNTNLSDGKALATALAASNKANDVEVIICTPFTHLATISEVIANTKNLALGAQNIHQEAKGAYTGEISADMLLSVGTEYVIIGHSERRAYFGEDNALLATKTDATIAAGLKPIFCCGEPLEIREAGTHVDLVTKQLNEGLFHLSEEDLQKVVIAYEPVWAIGTGVTASPAQAQEMHAAIRGMVEAKYGSAVADQMVILYGGSVKPANASELFSQADVDGGLVGGASLKAEDFTAIINSY